MLLTFDTEVAEPRRVVFDFFASPANLDTAYGPACRVLHHDGSIEAGAETWIELTLFGILQVVMGFEHTLCDPPSCFAERLIHGPFSTFEHRHDFTEAAGGTLIRDQVEVRARTWYGGRVATGLVAAPAIRRAIRYRGEALTRHGLLSA